MLRKHGAMLQSARGALPTLTEAIAGEPIRGSWWGHPQGQRIFRTLEGVYDSGEVAACRLVGGKLTLVHARLWPALLALFPKRTDARLDRVTQEHTASGAHRNIVEQWPGWLPRDVREPARKLDADTARAALGPLAALLTPSSGRPSRAGTAKRPSSPAKARRRATSARKR
jgi:hypothetical protein